MNYLFILTLTIFTLHCSNSNDSEKDSTNLKLKCASTQILYYSNCNDSLSKGTNFCRDTYAECNFVCGLAKRQIGCNFKLD